MKILSFRVNDLDGRGRDRDRDHDHDYAHDLYLKPNKLFLLFIFDLSFLNII